jgi:chemotaxis protein MotB
MVTETGFEPWRLSAAGYGEFHPRSANDGPDGRARNRRVDVVVSEPSSADGIVAMR